MRLFKQRREGVLSMSKYRYLWLCVILSALWIVGCGEEGGGGISIRYNRPAQYNVPNAVKKVAIVRFKAEKGTERKWSEIATDKLASALNAYNQKFHRYEIVDRKRVSAIMDERDFQMSVADTDQAVKFGKIANVDAMIYGTVYITNNVEVNKTSIPTPYGSIPVTTRRYQATAAINFTMDDIQTSKTICSVTVMRKYDSKNKKDKEKYEKYEKNLSAITTLMIQECVAEFLQKVSPHQVSVRVKLEKGQSKYTAEGNKFAKEQEYADAVDLYRAALNEDPGDFGAMFNMGVCYEALGQLKKAHKSYSRAVKIHPESKFIRARRRVRIENNGN